MPRSVFASFVIVDVVALSSAEAQTGDGSLRGYVKDDQSAVLPGATVTARGPALLTPVSGVTDSGGYYRLLNLPPGTYAITAELSGFSTSRREGMNTYQVLTDLNLDERYGPMNVDRRHILSLNGRTEVPKTKGLTLSSTLRWMSGAPFTIFDSNTDVDQNGELVDPLPAGTYSGTAVNAMTDVESKGGRNGAIGPYYFQIDVRAGWRLAWARTARSMSISTSSTSPITPTGTIRPATGG